MANAHDLAEWLGIPPDGLFNFKPSVRPVPLEVHIAGFPGKHYCPRMATMNKPTYRAILNHSPEKPVLVFVSSRRQTRLTALDLIAFCSADERGSQFVNMSTETLEPILSTIRDTSLRHTLAFGIGIHHAGLCESDRSTVERLFVEQSIMVLVCTSTLAWGVNFPAHLVVVKGTEFYDGKQKRYVDFPVTDVLQMMGRAGRPQFDQQGIAVILVHEPKKTFYRKFLYEPFPVESCLQEQLHDHINAEIVNGTITSKQDAVDFLTWTYFYRRLTRNPAYYHLDDASDETIAGFLSDLIETTFCDLENAGCIEVDETDSESVRPHTLGRVASYYYLKYTTVALFCAELHDVDVGPTELSTLLRVLCDASEFDELPVRHNEEYAVTYAYHAPDTLPCPNHLLAFSRSARLVALCQLVLPEFAAAGT
jgi:activating signal cointegrator complex subunit 3